MGRHVKNFEAATLTGDFYFSNESKDGEIRLSFKCPCGCGTLAGVKVRVDGTNKNGAWSWNKDREKPTTQPSINILTGQDGPSHWHGYLTDGNFKSC